MVCIEFEGGLRLEIGTWFGKKEQICAHEFPKLANKKIS
jgi:hypothetical protein